MDRQTHRYFIYQHTMTEGQTDIDILFSNATIILSARKAH